MDNAQKAIMIGVGLFIAIIIISAVLLITNLGTGLINNATGELGNISTQLQQQIVTKYDGTTLSGSEVLAAIRQYYNDSNLSLILYGVDGAGALTGVNAHVGARFLNENAITGDVGSTEMTIAAEPDAANPVNIIRFAGANTKTLMADFSGNNSAFRVNPGDNYNASAIRHATSNAVIGIAFQRIV